MIYILIDGDEVAYKSSVPNTTWVNRFHLCRNKRTMNRLYEETKETVGYQINPYWGSVTKQIDSMISSIKTACVARFPEEESSEDLVYISGKGVNFRKKEYETYKQNRKSRTLPFYLNNARSYILTKYKAKEAEEQEADDSIACKATELTDSGDLFVICSSDKDFLTVPGWTYNLIHKKFTYTDSFSASVNFWKQVLIGDNADNVKGIHGIGPIKAAAILKDCKTEQDMARTVREIYTKNNRLEDLQKNGFLLWLRRFPGQMWNVDEVLR